jgi:hypothetical protein
MSINGEKVYSRAQCEKLLGENPMHLKAFRPSNRPRPGHPEFIGPMPEEARERDGGIYYDKDGQAYMAFHEKLP